jgi:hypothetical protein
VIDRLSSIGSECSFNSSVSTSNSNSSTSSSGIPSTHKCLDCLRYACEECASVHSQVSETTNSSSATFWASILLSIFLSLFGSKSFTRNFYGRFLKSC